jgi:hypothetical protein
LQQHQLAVTHSAARGTVSQWVIRLILLRPASPSGEGLQAGDDRRHHVMTMLEVMYG